jgi:trans-aconitate 2-methyltransferase
MKTTDWNPDLYLKFDKERIQPSVDLVARIEYSKPRTIIDIGCGPGNSTRILTGRWPDASIIGADNSPAMIEKARADYPDQKWILFDAGNDTIDRKFDIVFSNSTIQWIPNHDRLIQRFSALLNDQGVLAVQLPLFLEMPIARSINLIAGQDKWQSLTRDVIDLFTIHDVSYYYEQLGNYFSKIDCWITDYYHIMDSHEAILEMIRSTGLKPYLDRIDDEREKHEFESLVLKRIEQDYPFQSDGRVLFPFKRLFFVAQK